MRMSPVSNLAVLLWFALVVVACGDNLPTAPPDSAPPLADAGVCVACNHAHVVSCDAGFHVAGEHCELDPHYGPDAGAGGDAP